MNERHGGTEARSREGTVTTEAAFVLLVLLLFMLLSPAIRRIWIAEIAAEAEAHRRLFHRAIGPAAAVGRAPPGLPVEPRIEPTPPEDLRGYRAFPNRDVMRPPWTWLGRPAVATQAPDETGPVRDWFRRACEATLDRDTVARLKLDTRPLE